MKKVCIFDFDGTLMDTFTDAGIFYNKALRRYCFPEHKLEEYKYLMGGSLEEVVARILPDNLKTEENINNVKNDYWKNYPNSEKINTKPYTGVVDLLKKLQEANIILNVNTNKRQNMVEVLCQKWFDNINFKSIIGQDGKILPKPNPEGVNKIVKNCNVLKEECVYIGDSKYDFETAKSAGIDAILVKWGAYNKDDEKYECIKFIADSPNDILKFVLES